MKLVTRTQKLFKGFKQKQSNFKSTIAELKKTIEVYTSVNKKIETILPESQMCATDILPKR